MSEKSVIDNIQKHYREFSPTERKVADCVLRHPNQVTEYTVKELAMASGVSEATVVRMCQHAGYTGYWPFRTMLARDMGMMGREEKRDNDQALSLIHILLIAIAARVAVPPMVTRYWNRLAKSRQIWFVSGTSSHPIPRFICHRLDMRSARTESIGISPSTRSASRTSNSRIICSTPLRPKSFQNQRKYGTLMLSFHPFSYISFLSCFPVLLSFYRSG